MSEDLIEAMVRAARELKPAPNPEPFVFWCAPGSAEKWRAIWEPHGVEVRVYPAMLSAAEE